jgi:hypothetical protein
MVLETGKSKTKESVSGEELLCSFSAIPWQKMEGIERETERETERGNR